MSIFDGFKVINRKKVAPICLLPGDTLSVTHHDEKGETILVTTDICKTQAMVVDEAVLFEGNFEGKRALGGMVVEKDK